MCWARYIVAVCNLKIQELTLPRNSNKVVLFECGAGVRQPIFAQLVDDMDHFNQMNVHYHANVDICAPKCDKN